MGQTADRIHWADIAKGILIILVVYGHLDFFASVCAGTSAYDFKAHTNFLLLPYYMPAFFIITGMFSSYEIPYGTFLKRNFMSLIVPSVLIGSFVSHWLYSFFNTGVSYSNVLDVNYKEIAFTGGSWFLSALFLSKLLFYVLYRISRSMLFIASCCIVFLLSGIFLYNNSIINPWYFQHAMIAVPFITIGFFIKSHQHILKHPLTLAIGCGVILYCYLHSYPYLNAMPNIKWYRSWLFLLLSTGGSFLIFYLSINIGKCRLLEYAGRHSLVIYLIHMPIMVSLIKLSVLLNVESFALPYRIVLGLAITVLSTFLCAMIDTFIDKHFPILKGK